MIPAYTAARGGHEDNNMCSINCNYTIFRSSVTVEPGDCKL